MTNSTIKNAVFAVAAIAVTVSGFSAASAQSRTTKSVSVDYSDLDLNTDDGAATLRGRVKGAVRQVCGGYDARSLRDTQDHGQCMEQASLSAKRATVTIMAAAAAGKPTQTAMVISN